MQTPTPTIQTYPTPCVTCKHASWNVGPAHVTQYGMCMHPVAIAYRQKLPMAVHSNNYVVNITGYAYSTSECPTYESI